MVHFDPIGPRGAELESRPLSDRKEGMSKILVTGAAGFIGFHTAELLLREGNEVVGLDNLNPYYDVRLKEARLAILKKRPGFSFAKLDLESRDAMWDIFQAQKFDQVVHLAAQAGVRYSITNPASYIDSNIVGFLNILEGCRHTGVKHLVYASSSSVYGLNKKLPFSEHDNVDHPISLYAATKKSNELMAHVYSHLFSIPTTGLRFFTVYGPWGRPDMALFKFSKAILQGEEFEIYNHGKMKRDFTYIDDIVDGIVKSLKAVPSGDPMWNPEKPDPSASLSPYRVFNIGNHRSEDLMKFVALIEKTTGKKANYKMVGMQPGDVPETFADLKLLSGITGFSPKTPIEVGIPKFLEWFTEYYGPTASRAGKAGEVACDV